MLISIVSMRFSDLGNVFGKTLDVFVVKTGLVAVGKEFILNKVVQNNDFL